ncbi:hypothetical protein NDU88_003656 [Pleurodeles waltl]|uniref:Uncharacterized protein n=1 Tax=Pleurodeles waltl TaxID=8319 RepID=A0AAV7WQ18_PLEWA|nr:hypothetical protein NDU88_003656 [Pleurodeles waltl]
MLTKTTGTHQELGGCMEEPVGSVIRTFLEALFSSLQEDLQEDKRDLSSELREVCRDLDEVGERVVSLEHKDDDQHEELEWMQQEILRLQDKQIELQAHAEDLKNRSRRNNICIWVPHCYGGI